jgi:hypothetical protein
MRAQSMDGGRPQPAKGVKAPAGDPSRFNLAHVTVARSQRRSQQVWSPPGCTLFGLHASMSVGSACTEGIVPTFTCSRPGGDLNSFCGVEAVRVVDAVRGSRSCARWRAGTAIATPRAHGCGCRPTLHSNTPHNYRALFDIHGHWANLQFGPLCVSRWRPGRRHPQEVLGDGNVCDSGHLDTFLGPSMQTGDSFPALNAAGGFFDPTLLGPFVWDASRNKARKVVCSGGTSHA